MFEYRNKTWLDIPSLIEDCVNGEDDALRLLFEEYKDLIIFILYSLGVREKTNLEDYAQDIWIKIYQNIHKLKDANAIKGWLAIIARNYVYERWRSKKPNTETLDDNTELHYEEPQDNIDMNSVMEQLPKVRYRKDNEVNEKVKKAILLRIDGYKQKEIAEQLNVPIGTISPWLTEEYPFLRRKLIEQGFDYDVRSLIKKYIKTKLKIGDTEQSVELAREVFLLLIQKRTKVEIKQILQLTEEPIDTWIEEGIVSIKKYLRKEGLEKSSFIPKWINLDPSKDA